MFVKCSSKYINRSYRRATWLWLLSFRQNHLNVAISGLLWVVPSTGPAGPLLDLPSHQLTSCVPLPPQAVNLPSALPAGLSDARSNLGIPHLHCPSLLKSGLSGFISRASGTSSTSSSPAASCLHPLSAAISEPDGGAARATFPASFLLIHLSTPDTFLRLFRSLPLFHTLQCSSLLAPGT